MCTMCDLLTLGTTTRLASSHITVASKQIYTRHPVKVKVVTVPVKGCILYRSGNGQPSHGMAASRVLIFAALRAYGCFVHMGASRRGSYGNDITPCSRSVAKVLPPRVPGKPRGAAPLGVFPSHSGVKILFYLGSTRVMYQYSIHPSISALDLGGILRKYLH